MNPGEEIGILEWQNALAVEEIRRSDALQDPAASYNPRYKDNVIVSLTFAFSRSVWELSDQLGQARRYPIANQLFRSGTAVGALVREAQNAESRADFIHKMKIALKEADETEYWLLLCRSMDMGGTDRCLDQLLPIIKVLNKIISTSHANRAK
ncbi:MAG TPA: four helix bundle protein [Flavobacteriales bacterium]